MLRNVYEILRLDLEAGPDAWYHVETTRPGGKPEWLTCNVQPTRRQVLLGWVA